MGLTRTSTGAWAAEGELVIFKERHVDVGKSTIFTGLFHHLYDHRKGDA
ncbi:MAG TPA: hypothetical protein VN421_01935 [Pseudoflavonifractor sp.]|nr:hypothetical protein [Pseudoflavonifractor sp.]